MADDQVKRRLQSIGFECFIKHIELFNDKGMSVDSAVKHLMDREKYTESGSRIRVSNARLIIRDGQLYDALKLVSLSKRVHSRWTDRARALLAINK